MTVDQFDLLEASVNRFLKRGGKFSWPDDSVAAEPWAYAFHNDWVGAWNDEGRVTPCYKFVLEFAKTWEWDDSKTT